MNILLIGNAGATNLGDDALLGGFVVAIKELSPQSTLTLMSSTPEATQELYQVESVPFFPFGFRSLLRAHKTISATKTACKKADIVIHGGGGLYTDIPSLYPVLLWGMHLSVINYYKRPYLCLGQSFGPLRSFLGKYITRASTQKSQATIVRDEKSKTTLEDIGHKSPILVAPDAVFLLPLRKYIIPMEKRTNRIIISLRPWQATDSLIYKLTPLIEQFIDQGLEVAFLPMQFIKEEDISIYNLLQSRTEAPITLLEPEDFFDAIEYIAEATMLIGMRLHTCMFATMTATPFLALSYSEKVENFVESVGLPEQTVNIHDASFSVLLQATQKTLSTLHALHTHLSRRRFQLHEEARSLYMQVLERFLEEKQANQIR